jgi:hypothetical protein
VVFDRHKLVVGGITVAILAVTLTPTGGGGGHEFSVCLGCGRRWLSDGLLNTALFVPFGIASGWNARSFWRVVVAGALLSTIIELTQTVVPGRDPELADIIFNTAGALCGAIIASRPHSWLVPSPRRAVQFLVGSIVAIASVIAVTGALLAPMSVRNEVSGQLAPVAALARRGARLTFTGPAMPPPSTLTPLMYFYDTTYMEWLFVGRFRNDAVVRYRSRAWRFGLDQPEYVARSVFEGAATGAQTRVELWRESHHWCIRVAAKHDCRLGPTVGRGWSVLFYPDAIGERWGGLVDACWAAALLIPLGFWTRGRTVVLAVVGAIALFALVPTATRLVSTPLEQWFGGLVGVAIGYALSRLARSGVSSAAS